MTLRTRDHSVELTERTIVGIGRRVKTSDGNHRRTDLLPATVATPAGCIPASVRRMLSLAQGTIAGCASCSARARRRCAIRFPLPFRAVAQCHDLMLATFELRGGDGLRWRIRQVS